MNGFLVVLNHTMDDLAIEFFRTRTQAVSKAQRMKPMPSQKIRRIYGTDCSTPISVSVVEFVDGKPVVAEVIRHFSGWGGVT